MFKINRHLVLLFLCAVIFDIGAAEKETITWYRPGAAPGHIVEGDFSKQGYSDLMQSFLIDNLKEYRHVDALATYERALEEMRNTTGCIVGIFPNDERKAYLSFSVVRQLVLSNGLILPQRHIESVTPYIVEGKISLHQFWENVGSKLIGGVAKGRVYGDEIDNQVQEFPERFSIRASLDVFAGLFQMLEYGRVDYIFGFPVELQYARKLFKSNETFHFIPIAEFPEYFTSNIACSKNETGKEVIKKINNQLLKYRHTDEMLDMYASWLDEESARRFKVLSKQYFLLNANK